MGRTRIEVSHALAANQLRYHGEAGRRWLDDLPSTLEEIGKRWQLEIEAPFANAFVDYVAPVRRVDGSRAVLKLCFIDDEFFSQETALRAFAGRGCVRLLDADLSLGALLLERIEPGTMLSEMADEEAAISAAASIMRGLWRDPPEDYAFPTASDWVAHACHPAAIPGRKRQLPWAQRALERARELDEESEPRLLLHGDLHHYNILAAEREPWLAIDPHGIIGDPAWELAPFLINCLERFDRTEWAGVIRRRADQFIDHLGLDAERAYAWNAARALQCAFWSLRDDTRWWDAAVVCAEELAKGT